MRDKSMKAIIEHNGKRAYINFVKSYQTVFDGMKRIFPNDDIYFQTAATTNLRFTEKDSKSIEFLKSIIKPDDSLLDIYKALDIVNNHDDEFLKKLGKMPPSSISSLNTIYTLYELDERDKSLPIPKKIDINDMNFQPMNLFNKEVIFTPNRISVKDVPKGLYKYECQSDDHQDGLITMISKNIHINFWGTILTNKKIGLDRDGYRYVDEENDIKDDNRTSIKLKEYLSNHPIKKELER